MEHQDEKFMKRCLDLARQGLGTTYPNPLVGSVIVCDGKIIGEGWHQYAGGPHAEVRAVEAVKDKSMLGRSVLYVNLEPCSHHGRTPPCADLIVKHGIPKVVIGSLDENQVVCGRGVQRLREQGCEVVIGILEEQCRQLNRRFFTYHQEHRPYIILKWAQSSDGFIYPSKEKVSKGKPFWITNRLSRQRVHKWRAEEAAILVGRKTLEMDDPELSVRDFKGNQLLRVALARDGRVPLGSKFGDGSQPTVLFCHQTSGEHNGVQVLTIDFDRDVLPQVVERLWQMEVQSLIVEGGTETLESFIRCGLWDEARVFIGQFELGEGIRAPEFRGDLQGEEAISGDRLLYYKREFL